MQKTFIVALLISSALVACGGKNKKSTTPDRDNKGGTSEIGSGATGGITYGGAAAGSAAPMPAGGANPCAGR